MRIYDISLSISPKIPTWPGDPKIEIERIQKIEEGAESNVTHLKMTVHTGTHVDAPYHFLGGEADTIEQLNIKLLIGRVYVLHVADTVNIITESILKETKIPPRTRRLIIRSKNSIHWKNQDREFEKNFVAISPDGAQYLVNRGIKLIGVDYLSVAPFEDVTTTHKILLNAGVVILEGLDLSEISQGRYTLYCLPLKIDGADGSPARAILVRG